jgi:hypothetical protein
MLSFKKAITLFLLLGYVYMYFFKKKMSLDMGRGIKSVFYGVLGWCFRGVVARLSDGGGVAAG